MFLPTVNTVLTVTLPGETLRAPVTHVVDRHTVFVQLTGTPLNPARAHSYRKDDMVAVRRAKGPLGEFWQAVDDRVLFQRPPTEAEPAAPRKTAPKKAAPKKGAKHAVGRK